MTKKKRQKLQQEELERQHRLQTNNSVDFDDLLLLPVKLFKEKKYKRINCTIWNRCF